MEPIENIEHRKKIKISDDELVDMVMSDRDEAEKYFSTYVAEKIKMRYDLMHSNGEYYTKEFPKLQELCSFSTTDVKDVIEWLMPSFTEVFFGSDKIIGIFGRTRDDNPEVLEKIVQFQMQNQNNGYVILDQWIRDALESGLGVIRLDWEHREKPVLKVYHAMADEFINMPTEVAEKIIKKVEPLPDGTYNLTIREMEVIKDQAVIRNIKPGEYIYIPKENEDGKMVFECHRKKVLYHDLLLMQKAGVYKNVKDFDFVETSNNDSMELIDDAIVNYDGEKQKTINFYSDASEREGQEARKMVMVYDCYGQYDVDNDGLLEYVHAIVSNGKLLFAEINEVERSPFFHISFYANSYQKWKEGVADFLIDIQNLKTAIIRQIIINASINNDRTFGVDMTQTDAIKDIEAGKKVIRCSLSAGRKMGDVMQPMPQYPLEPATFQLLELANLWGEQKTGITKYNQGLDANSLNKTATGISKIMEASQQRMRKMARDAAENGMVPLYKHLIKLDKMYLQQPFVFRLTNKYYEFTPDDIDGEFDVQITSNIGLQDKQLTTQNLLLLFTQILPQLMQYGCAAPAGAHEIATQIIESMGFSQPDQYLGIEANAAAMQMTANTIVQMLPQIMQQLGQQMNITPEQAGAIAQTLAQQIQAIVQQSAQQAQQLVPQTPPQQQTPQQMAQLGQIQNLASPNQVMGR